MSRIGTDLKVNDLKANDLKVSELGSGEMPRHDKKLESNSNEQIPTAKFYWAPGSKDPSGSSDKVIDKPTGQ
jgi:hypothetical protein